jgi:uncharacterized protein involved in response to NO
MLKKMTKGQCKVDTKLTQVMMPLSASQFLSSTLEFFSQKNSLGYVLMTMLQLHIVVVDVISGRIAKIYFDSFLGRQYLKYPS